MADLNTKYLDYTGLGRFLSQLKGYIGGEIAKIHGDNLYLYDSGENNPTITSQIEDIWELIGTTDGTKGSLAELISKLQTDLGTETTNRTNEDLALGTRIDNLNERLESVETSYVKNVSSANSSTKDTKYIEITANNKKSGEVTININDGVLSETMDTVLDEQSNMANQILALAAGLSLTASASPSTIYKNTSTSITITASTKDTAGDVTASEIKIMDGGTVLKTAANAKTTSVAKSITTTSNTYTFKTEATVNGMKLSKNATVNARYPVCYGMGTSASDVKTNGKKASARTTAISNTTYDATASANGVRFYLLVPNDVTRPSSFTMGGAPVDMTYTDVTLDGIVYRAYYTVATYNVGGEVKIKAQ